MGFLNGVNFFGRQHLFFTLHFYVRYLTDSIFLVDSKYSEQTDNCFKVKDTRVRTEK